MVYLSGWFPVFTLEALVASCWQVHVSSLFGNLDTLELSIMEVIAIINVLSLRWVKLLLQISKVILSEFRSIFGCKRVLNGMIETFLVLVVDGGTR